MFRHSPASGFFPRGFYLVCPEAGQIQHPTSFTEDLQGFFSSERLSWLQHEWWLWATFARPVANVQRIQTYRPSRGAVPAAIEKLPNELLDEIFKHLSERKDVLALGLSSAIMWPLVHYHIQQDYERSAGMWAGKRVLYLGQGDYDAYFSFDFPPPAEAPSLHAALFSLQCMPWHIEKQLYTNEPSIKLDITETVGQQLAEALASVKHWNIFSPADLRSIEQDLSPCMYPKDRVWVLRNLTTCEFIRSDKLKPSVQRGLVTQSSAPETRHSTLSKGARIAALLKQGAAAFTSGRRKTPERKTPERKTLERKTLERKTLEIKTPEINPPGVPNDTAPLTFAQIFLVLSCFSRQTPQDEKCFEFQEGRWAGHSFDIVTFNTHIAETNPLEWADVSELAVDDVANLRHWVQYLGRTSHHKYHRPGIRKHVSEDRRMYHDWEGLDTQSSSGNSGWSQKPVQRGLLVSLQSKGKRQ